MKYEIEEEQGGQKFEAYEGEIKKKKKYKKGKYHCKLFKTLI